MCDMLLFVSCSVRVNVLYIDSACSALCRGGDQDIMGGRRQALYMGGGGRVPGVYWAVPAHPGASYCLCLLLAATVCLNFLGACCRYGGALTLDPLPTICQL